MAAVSKGTKTLQALCPPNEWIVIQGTLRLDRYSAPDPDRYASVTHHTREQGIPLLRRPQVVLRVDDLLP